MTKEPTDKMTDEQITEAAAALMGWQRKPVPESMHGAMAWYDSKGWIAEYQFDPLNDTDDALRVLEKCADKYATLTLRVDGWRVWAGDAPFKIDDAHDFRRAICLAALAAVRSKR